MEVMAKVETENKATVKAMMSSPEVSALLASLEFNGQPKWGLSTLERETVKAGPRVGVRLRVSARVLPRRGSSVDFSLPLLPFVKPVLVDKLACVEN